MSYHCLLTVLTDEELVEVTLRDAIKAAETYDAHLDVLCLGVDRSQTGYYYVGASSVILQDTISHAQKAAHAVEASAEKILKNTSLRWSSEMGAAQVANVGRHVAARARFSDIVVLPKPYGEGRGIELEVVAEAALFEANTPAIILPEKDALVAYPKRIVVGWNESTEAVSAVRAAMPLLTRAEIVHVVIVDPPAHGPERSDPGGMLSQYLARHDVKVKIDVLSRTLPRVSDVLMRHATDVDADMLVMGAYGHSRFREAIFGGATRNMLEQAALPVLMAH